MDASLKLNLGPRERPRVADRSFVENAKKQIEARAVDIKQRHDYLKETPIAEIRARFNLSKDVYKDQKRNAEVRVLKKQLELEENRAKIFREAQSKIEQFFDNPIPIEIYFEVQGRRVVLATSKG